MSIKQLESLSISNCDISEKIGKQLPSQANFSTFFQLRS